MGWKDVFTAKASPLQRDLEESMAITRQLTEVLEKFVQEEDAGRQTVLAADADDLEHRGDQVRQRILDRLQRTFVTPFDREDVNDLSRAVDDIADYAENTIKELQLYQVQPDGFVRSMVETLRMATAHLEQAVRELAANRIHSAELARQAKAMENRMEGLYRQAIAHLATESDIHYLIKLREIYRHLSNAADRVDMAANVITSIVIKEGG